MDFNTPSPGVHINPIHESTEPEESGLSVQPRLQVPIDAIKAPQPIVPIPAGSSSRFAMMLGGAALLVLVAVGLLFVNSRKLNQVSQNAQLPALGADAQNLPTSAKFNGLAVTNAIVGTLKITGATTLQGAVDIQGDLTSTGNISALTFNGQTLTISGASTLANLTAANITATGSVTVGGTISAKNISGVFQGTFSGDGSKLTNLDAATCLSCVKLQPNTNSPQTGNVAVSGDLALSGDISARRGHFKSTTTDAFSVTTTTGETVLAADTLNQTLTVGALLPKTPGALAVGSVTPGTTTTIVATGAGSTQWYNDNGHWSVLGPDGFTRFAYIDWIDSTVHYVRCQNRSCSQNVNSIVDTDATNSFDSVSIALDHSGNAYLSYIDYASPNHIVLTHCTNVDCTTKTTQALPDMAQYGYNNSLAVDGQGNADVVYDTYDYSVPDPTFSLELVHCTNPACSTFVQTTIVQSTQSGGGSYNEASAIKTGTDGLPRIAFVDNSDDHISYIKCANYACTSPVLQAVNAPQTARYWMSMAIGSDDLAKFVYQGVNQTNGTLYYSACSDSSCTSATSTMVIDQSVYAGGYGDLVLSPTNVATISSYGTPAGGGNARLLLATCNDVACSSPVIRNVADIGDGYSSSITRGPDGIPQVAYLYHDVSSSVPSVRFATFANANGSNIVVPGQVTQGTNIGTNASRFGTLAGQNIDLQTATATAALLVNQKAIFNENPNVATVQGPIADFQANGQSVLSVTSTGVVVGASSTLSAAQVALSAQPSQTSAVLQATNSSGNNLLNLQPDGTLNVGFNSICAGCIPTKSLTDISTGAFPGYFRISGHYLYLTQDGTPGPSSAVQVYDISTPSSPRIVSKVGNEGTLGLDIVGNYLYVTELDPANKLHIYNIANPAQPIELSSTNTQANTDVFAIKVVGQYAYIVGRNNLEIFDVSNPASPVSTGVVFFTNIYPVGASDITIVGTTAFVLNSYIGYLMSVDISNPSAPAVISYFNIGQSFAKSQYGGEHMALSGNHLYLGCDYASLCIYNISDPSNIVRETAVTLPTGFSNYQSQQQTIEGTTLYVQFATGMCSYNITNPINPILIDQHAYGSYNYDFAHYGGYFYSSDLYGNVLRVLSTFTDANFQSLHALTATIDGDVNVGGTIKLGTSATITQRFGGGLTVTDGTGNTLASFDTTGRVSATSVEAQTGTFTSIAGVSTVANNPSGTTTPGLNVKWYNGSNTPGSGTLANTSIDTTLNWQNSAPAGVDGANINAVWTGWVKADVSGTYSFGTTSDDGSQLLISGKQVVYNMFYQGATFRSGSVDLIANTWYPIRMEFFQGGGPFGFSVSWMPPGTFAYTALPADHTSATLPAGNVASAPRLNVSSDLNVIGNLSFSNAITASSASSVALPVQGLQGQTGDLFRASLSDGTLASSFDRNGSLTIQGAAGVSSNFITTKNGTGTNVFEVTREGRVVIHGNNEGGSINNGYVIDLVSFSGNANPLHVGGGGVSFFESGLRVGTPNGALYSGSSNTVVYGFNGNAFVGDAQGNTGVGVTAISGPSSPFQAFSGSNLVADIGSGGITTYRTFTNSTSGFQVQKADATAVLTVDTTNTKVVVKSLDVNGTLTLSGHLVTANASGTTTASPGAQAGTGATCTVAGNDTSGTVTIGTGTAPSAGILCTLTFATTYGAAPRVILTPATGVSTTIQYYFNSSTSNFTIRSNNAPTASTSYIYTFLVAE